jgi:hypothetical protein
VHVAARGSERGARLPAVLRAGVDAHDDSCRDPERLRHERVRDRELLVVAHQLVAAQQRVDPRRRVART